MGLIGMNNLNKTLHYFVGAYFVLVSLHVTVMKSCADAENSMIVNFIKDRFPRAPLAKRNPRGAYFLVESDNCTIVYLLSHSEVELTRNTPKVFNQECQSLLFMILQLPQFLTLFKYLLIDAKP